MIKQAGSEHLDAIMALLKQDRKNFGPLYPSHILNDILKGDSFVYIDDDGAVVGAVINVRHPRKQEFELNKIAVDRDHRRQHIGEQLLKRSVEQYNMYRREEGYDHPFKIYAHLGASNNPFYERFCDIESTKAYKSVTNICYVVKSPSLTRILTLQSKFPRFFTLYLRYKQKQKTKQNYGKHYF